MFFHVKIINFYWVVPSACHCIQTPQGILKSYIYISCNLFTWNKLILIQLYWPKKWEFLGGWTFFWQMYWKVCCPNRNMFFIPWGQKIYQGLHTHTHTFCCVWVTGKPRYWFPQLLGWLPVLCWLLLAVSSLIHFPQCATQKWKICSPQEYKAANLDCTNEKGNI